MERTVVPVQIYGSETLVSTETDVNTTRNEIVQVRVKSCIQVHGMKKVINEDFHTDIYASRDKIHLHREDGKERYDQQLFQEKSDMILTIA